MEIRDLRTFLKIAELQSFSRAAEALGYVQSSVSAQIRRLEEDIGAPLFNRFGKSVSLTQCGEELLPLARELVSLSVQIGNNWRTREELGGTVRIGIVESLFGCIMEEAVKRFHRSMPKVQIEVTVDGTAVLKEMVKRGELDGACIIDDPLPGEKWQTWYMGESSVVVTAGASHPLAGRTKLCPADLSEASFVLMEDTAPYCVQFYRLAAQYRLEPRVFLKLQNADMACRLAAGGGFVSVLPRYTVQPYVNRGELVILPVPELEQRQAIRLILHPGKIVTPQIAGFMNGLKERLSSETFRQRLEG